MSLVHTTFFGVLMLCAGIGIPFMAALNADMGTRLDSPIAAVFVLSSVAAIGAFIMLFVIDKVSIRHINQLTIFHGIAGLLFLFYIVTITISAPKIGLGNAVFLVLIGQLLSAAVIDHWGWFNSIRSPISLYRVIGIVFMTIGISLAQIK